MSNVSELNLKYLEASFEAIRRTALTICTLSAGGIVAVIGLITKEARDDIPLERAAIVLRTPVSWLLASILFSLAAMLMMHLSAHGAAWGRSHHEKHFRWSALVLIGVAFLSFGGGTLAALDAFGDLQPAPRESSQQATELVVKTPTPRS